MAAGIQRYLAHKKRQPPWTLRFDHAYPYGGPREVAVSCERCTPVVTMKVSLLRGGAHTAAVSIRFAGQWIGPHEGTAPQQVPMAPHKITREGCCSTPLAAPLGAGVPRS